MSWSAVLAIMEYWSMYVVITLRIVLLVQSHCAPRVRPARVASEIVRGILDESPGRPSEESRETGGAQFVRQRKGHRRVRDGAVHGVTEMSEIGGVSVRCDPIDRRDPATPPGRHQADRGTKI